MTVNRREWRMLKLMLPASADPRAMSSMLPTVIEVVMVTGDKTS